MIKFKVLSLFDGISCGMLALKRAGIEVEKYAAFEIDKYALTVSMKNFYSQIDYYGDVFNADFTQFKGYDLLIGGSPCTYWSIAKKGRETTSDGMGFKLFMEYVRALKESECKYFLYENNFSIHKNIKAEISKYLGVEPVMINSALLSAQNRKRCYWTNIPNVRQPRDKGIYLKDVLESGISVRYDRKKGIRYATDKAVSLCASDWRGINRNQTQNAVAEPIAINDVNGKSLTIKAQYSNTGLANAVRNDRFGATMVAEPIRIGEIGNGGQGERIYSIYGKSVSIKANGGGGGAKTGLYKIDLPDGDYIIRKLTPIEAERLQTLPDNYTAGISDTQRYKCIGNGWTVEVIAHIFRGLHKAEIVSLDDSLNKCADNNITIYTSIRKAQRILLRSYAPICSISGGADSDIVLDLIHKVDEDCKVKYFWFDTGLEYTATKEHLAELEQKYGIEIIRIKPDKPIPTCVKEYGIPFLSKYVSEQMMRLQQHNFRWEDEPLEILLQKYPNCKTALQWWCGERYSDENGVQKISRFSIYRNKWLKEFIMQNPPDFPISNKCCEYAKKKLAKRIVKEFDADLDMTGIRKAEGGIRSVAFKTCFSECKSKGCDTFRPIFWYTDKDKTDYEQMFDVQHSRCYTEYGLKRTGCVGCPFSKHINEELAVIEKYEPNLYKAAMNLFGKSYEYTAKYRAFAKEMKTKQ